MRSRQLARLPVSMPRAEKRAKWGDGPWLEECDWAEWVEEGFLCLARRNEELGVWLGYVALPEGHPWYGEPWDAIDASVHGGLNFAAGAPDGLWWIGFDCARAFDVMPFMHRHRAYAEPPHSDDSDVEWSVPRYRTLAFVKAELSQLVQQAKAATRLLGGS